MALILSLLWMTCLCLGIGCSKKDDNPPRDTYRLFPKEYFSPDYEESYTLKGLTPDPKDLTGSYQIHTGTPTLVNGEVMIPASISITIIDAAKQSTLSNTIIIYYNQNFAQTKVFNTVTTVTYIADTLISLPERSRPGDRGELTSWTGSDGTRQNGTWRMEKFGPGLAKLTFYSEFKDATDNITIREQYSRIIDASGHPKEIRLTIHYLTPDRTISLIGQKTK